jgi:hypothetical protein
MKIKSQSKGGGTAPTSKRVMGNKVAGGIGSRVVNPQGIRDGQKAFPVSPRGVSQIGSAIGNKVTAEVGGKINYRGEPWRSPRRSQSRRRRGGGRVQTRTLLQRNPSTLIFYEPR